MSIYTIDELQATIGRFAEATPIRWSDDRQGGAAAARHLGVALKSLRAHPTVLIHPTVPGTTVTPQIETVADLAQELRVARSAYCADLPVLWCPDPLAGPGPAQYLTAELETFDDDPTVVIFPA